MKIQNLRTASFLNAMILSGVTFLALATLVYSQWFIERVTLSSSNPTYTFTSPNYQAWYVNSRCKWIINAPSAETINLSCTELSINCHISYFHYMSNNGVALRYCGEHSIQRSDPATAIMVVFSQMYRRSRWRNSFKCTASFTSATTDPQPPIDSQPSTESTPSMDTDPPMTNCTCGVANAIRSRIVNGVNANLHEFPWMVALRLRNRNVQFCGGSLIDSEWVLTAAHCVDGMSATQLRISLADHDVISNEETNATIHLIPTEIIMHENYHEPTLSKDIALIKIPKVTFTTEISPICLPINSKSIEGKKGTVIGWGVTSEGGNDPDVLQKLDIDMLTVEECRQIWKGNPFLFNENICAYNEENLSGSCHGDSGGPMILREGDISFVVGIVSYGFGCARKNFPGVYTRVESYIDWIETKTATSFCVK